MGEFSIWHWIIFLLYLVVFGIPLWKISTKAGFPGWASVAFHIPFFNIFALWLFAFTKWPNQRD
jgi:hypothetical protein